LRNRRVAATRATPPASRTAARATRGPVSLPVRGSPPLGVVVAVTAMTVVVEPPVVLVEPPTVVLVEPPMVVLVELLVVLLVVLLLLVLLVVVTWSLS
jgi:hypothetical protein